MQKRVYSLLGILPSIIVLALTAGLFGLPRAARAADTVVKQISFSASTYQRGFSYTSPDGSMHGVIQSGTLSGPATITVTQIDSTNLPNRKNFTRIADAFKIDVTGEGVTLLKPIDMIFVIPRVGFVSSIAKFDSVTGSWEELGSALSTDGTHLRSSDDKLSFTLAAFQNMTRQEGLATYYGTYTRTTKLVMVAASNVFPKGQLVRVTNLETGKVISVQIVDSGGFGYPRVIDLSTPAFAKLQPTWKGVVRVRVEKATPWNKPASVLAEDPVPLLLSGGVAPILDGSTPPTTAATASIVVDVASGQMLLGKNTTLALPIASLTKLMTAAVVMDTKPDLNAVFTYTTALDKAQYCSCLYLANGEQVTIKDLLFASLVGSTNNATLALARSTGLTRAEFVRRMNAKAAALGLTHTFYVEPSGLDPGNVSSPADLATIMRAVPDANATIRRALSTGSYSFISKNTVCLAAYRKPNGTCSHSLVTTNKLFGKTSFTLVAAKTGFIDEARHTFALRGKDAKGHELIVVLLKTYNAKDSFNGANGLMNWTFKHAIWS